MPNRSSQHPPRQVVTDVRPARRVPIAMALALEVVAEMRKRERQSAERVMNEVFAPPPRPNRSH